MEIFRFEGLVDFDAAPGVGSGIELLAVGQVVGLPVGEALSFRNLFPDDDGIDFLQTLVFDAVSFDKFLQLDKVARSEWPAVESPQHAEVVLERDTHLEQGFVFEQPFQGRGEPDAVKPEQVAGIVGRELHEGHVVALSLLECRSGFGVKSDNRLVAQTSGSFGYLGFVVDHDDSSGE